MPDSAAIPVSFSAELRDAFPLDDLLAGVFAASLTALALLKPIWTEEGGAIIDFTVVLLNEAGQRMLGQPAQTHMALFSSAGPTGVFDFYCGVFETGQPGQRELNYQHDGLDNYFRISARRVGQGLVVSFTDTASESRTAVEVALRESQAREQAARIEVDNQRAALYETFMQAPAMICIFAGPDHVFELVNPQYQQLVGERPLLGRPIRQAMPELQGQSIFGLLDEVYRTGEVFRANEMLVQLDNYNSGGQELEKRYYNFIYQPRRNAQGAVDGILVFAYEVSEQVRARQQLEATEQQAAQTNEELAAANEELQAANEEVRLTNDDLFHAQLTLRELNQELEARVADRTSRLRAAQTEAERQRARLERFFMQAPAAICVLDGPDLVFELVNPEYQALFPGRRLAGQPLLEAMPELANHPVWHSLREVYETGVTHYEESMLIPVARYEGEPLEDRYFNYVQQARYDENGQIDGILAFAFEVTEQVRARQQSEELQAQALQNAEQLVRQRETLYQVFEQTPASVAILRGPEHRFDYLNPGYQALFPGRKLLGLPLAEALPETVEFGFVALLDQVYATGEPFFGTELPLQVYDTAGNLLPEAYYTFTYQAYHEDGATVGVSIFAFDVTEQVHARRRSEQMQAEALQTAEHLARQRETLHQVFEQTPALVFIARGPEHRIDYVNPAYQSLFPDRVLMGQPTAVAIPEAAEHGFIALLDHVYETNKPYFGNEVLAGTRRLDGHEVPRYLNFTYQAYQENGVTVGVSSFAFDVSEQVAARQQAAALQEEVRQRDAQLQDLFEQAPVSIAVMRGPEFVVELANPGMCTLWGHTREEVLGRPMLTCMPELRGQGFDLLLEGVMATGVAYSTQEKPAQLYRHGQTEVVHVNFVYQPLRNGEGHITGVAVVATNVSEQVAARQLLAEANAELTAANQAVSARNEELAAANQQLIRTNQDLDNFVYAASHDLKQPINNLTGLFEELRYSTVFTDPDEQALLVPMLDEALRQLATTIDDLAAVGQMQRLPNLPPDTVALDELTQEVLQTLQPQVQAARARVTTDFAARPTISYARANLRTILLNLLGNSLKYADPSRPCRVHLSLWVEEDRPLLLVEDNGLGFDVRRHKGELFHLFRRFHDHTEGTGVGLYLVNRIVQSNGGRVEVESEVGVGTTFRVFL
ncbi:PAS domain-containing protein [Hymenobacter terrenus]|uniref:PAS domain-containing protein n=1 Tax=Hymenobacter terrenus TaxID=1629124 RepID=UPI000695DC56|nr:PAS domain-containing protein [Hymenobacter terrenus]